jgi:predicted lipoprotein
VHSKSTLSDAPTKRRRVRPWIIWTLLAVVVLLAGGLTTRFVSAEAAEEAASGTRFDPAAYTDERFDDEIVPQVEEEAVDLAVLLEDLAGGADEAEFGHAPGAGSSYSFPVEFTGVAGAPNGSIVPVTVEGVASDVVVQVQIGPALNGTALRDVTGTVSFNEFTNQLEFQEVATEFNDRVRDEVLTEVDPATLEGSTIHVVGAFTRVNPALVSVVPVVFEVNP